jgi:hypothetical protein
MQEELKGAKDKEAEGALTLNVENKLPQSITKADGTIDLSLYPISITGTSDKETAVNENYIYQDIQGKSVTLPVGTYTISAQTPGELTKQMTAPYFAGSDELSISKDLTVEKKIICSMLNTKIDMVYGTDFTSRFKSWTITIDDGSNSVITYTDEDTNPATIYYYLGEEGAETLTMNVTAVTNDDKTIKMRTELTKSNVVEQYPNDTENFVGGDAVKFNMGVELDGVGNLTITIAANVWFEDEDEEFGIDITDKVEQPSNPDNSGSDSDNSGDDADGPQLVCDAFETGVTFSLKDKEYPNTDVTILTPAGMKSLKVYIKGGNETFDQVMVEMGFQNEGGYDIIDTDILSSVGEASGKEIADPKSGDTEFVFSVSTFYNIMTMYGTTDANGHIFNITVEDENGKTATAALKVVITE